MKFAQILNNKVYWVGEYNKVPEFHQSAGEFIDITDDTTGIAEGWGHVDGIFASPETPNTIYLHLAMTTLNGEKPTCIKNNNTDELTISCTLKDTNGNTIPITFPTPWKLPIRGSNGGVYDIVEAVTTNGVGEISYKTIKPAEICSIKQSDLIPIVFGGTTYQIKLTGQTSWMVY